MMENVKYTEYKNGIKLRRKNTRLLMVNTEKGVMIEINHFRNNPENKPTCSYECKRGKINITNIKFSDEGMEMLMLAYMQLKGKLNPTY